MSARTNAQKKEDAIRKAVRELSDDKRLEFFTKVEGHIKDPDTYAALNYIFVAGLHHFYVGRWIRGLINIFTFMVGIVLFFNGYFFLGTVIVFGVSFIELLALFRAQIIIKDYNNRIMEEIYQDIQGVE